MGREIRCTLLWIALSLCAPAASQAQTPANGRAPAVDTIVIRTHNVFTGEQAHKLFAFRLLNALHVTTRYGVVRRELLFRQGEPYDSIRVEESERNLRSRRLFQHVSIDTLRLDGKLAVVVETRDGWSTKARAKLTLASEGTWTGALGVTEGNLLGTGNLFHAGFLKRVDRQGPELKADFRRLFGSQIALGGHVVFWDDGTVGDWRLVNPFLSSLDRGSFQYSALAADRRALRFRVNDPATRDTVFYQRRAFINQVTLAYAPNPQSTHYFRLGARAEVRREEYIFQRDTGLAIPDTVYGELGLLGEYRRLRFRRTRWFNGFNDEDIDLSLHAQLSLGIASSVLGYERDGIGPHLQASIGQGFGRGFAIARLNADGLFNGAGLDSGQVIADLTLGLKPWKRHSTVLFVTAGAQENPPPGHEFDLGFDTPPRSWEPHSFVGTRMIWGTFEHRWFAWDALLDLVSLGFAFFADYGGAWYPDQSPRFGGDIGIGLRQAMAVSSGNHTGRIDIGYRFGDGAGRAGGRWVVTIGAGLRFPWRRSSQRI